VERVGTRIPLSRLGTFDIQVHHDRFLSAADHHGFHRLIGTRIHLLMWHERRHIDEIAGSRFGDVFEMVAPTEASAAPDNVQYRFEFAMVMRPRAPPARCMLRFLPIVC
jgi:hypothetical protein